MKYTELTFAALVGFSAPAFSVGGDATYQFLTLPTSSQVYGLGGSNVSSHSGDVALSQQNPALLSIAPSSSVSLSYVNYICDAQYGSIAYGQAIDSLSWFGLGLTFLNYGSFDAYNEYDMPDGTFSASDMNLSLAYARKLSTHFTAGLALKPVYSHIEDYNSFGLALDLGGLFYLPEENFSAGVAVRNFGVQFSAYDENKGSLPWDIQLGFSKKLAHAPFGFNVTYVKLNDWDFDYVKEASLYKTSSSYVEAEYKENVSWGDMFVRHLIFGLEFVPSKNFSLMASYNHRRHKEFAMEEAGGGAGWSFGANLHVYKFSLGASYALYGPSGGVFGINLSSCINDFKKN